MSDPILLIVCGAVGTVVFLAIAVCGGFWAGLQCAGRAYVTVSDELADLQLERKQWLASLRQLNEKMEKSHELSEIVGLLAQSAHSSISPDLFRAIDSMIQTTRTLARELHAFHEAQQSAGSNHSATQSEARPNVLPPPIKHLRLKGDEEAVNPALTKHEMWEVTGQHCLADSSADLESRRYLYDCLQYLAPWDGEESLPDSDKYTAVRCHDISVTGVSFLWPELPPFSRAIIVVGSSDSPIYMVIEVSQYRSVYMDGDVCYLVGSRFVNRLERSTEESRKPEAVLCS